MERLLLLVDYSLRPGARAEFLAGLEESGLRAAVLKEPGCLRYDYYTPLAEEGRLLLVEEWESAEAQRVHLTQPHMAAFRSLKERCVESTAILRARPGE